MCVLCCCCSCCNVEDGKERSNAIVKDIYNYQKKIKYTLRVLLLGPAGSGKTTILKQMKILHFGGYSDEETIESKDAIFNNVHEAIYTLITNLSKFELIYDSCKSFKSADYILNLGKSPNKFDTEYGQHVKTVWEDKNIQMLYKKRNYIFLNDSAKYFLDQVDKLFAPDYLPTIDDLLNCRQVTMRRNNITFDVKHSGGNQPFEMIDVCGQRGERRKWIQAFEGVNAVLFIASCSDFNQVLPDDPKINCLEDALESFSSVWHNRYLQAISIILFLNKQDILEEKLNSGEKISKYYPEYKTFKYKNEDYESSWSKECNKARYFIINKMMAVTKRTIKNYNSSQPKTDNRGFYYHYTVATNTENIRFVFNACYIIIKHKHLENYETT